MYRNEFERLEAEQHETEAAERERATATVETEITAGFSVEEEEMYIPLEEYKRMFTAEILLRVLLAADIGAYGTCNNIIDAVRQVYAAEIMGEKKEGENAE